MKNTIENKKLFFAQYYNQEVLNVDDMKGSCHPELIENSYLELKPLSKITDEDAKQLSYRVGTVIGLDQRIKKSSVDLVKEVIDNYTQIGCMWMLPARFTDKARELGYAIEWNEVSVEKQIEYKWLKLI